MLSIGQQSVNSVKCRCRKSRNISHSHSPTHSRNLKVRSLYVNYDNKKLIKSIVRDTICQREPEESRITESAHHGKNQFSESKIKDQKTKSKSGLVSTAKLSSRCSKQFMMLFRQVVDLKTKFDKYQNQLEKEGTSVVYSDLIKSEVFQECAQLKYSLKHISNNYKIFTKVVNDLFVEQVSKARYGGKKRTHRHRKK